MYLKFLEEQLLNMWFMHDHAPPQFSLLVGEHLNGVYPVQRIGRSGPV